MVKNEKYAPKTKIIIYFKKEFNKEEDEEKVRFEKIDTASTQVIDDATTVSSPFQPSSPHYSPDSEAPSDESFTYTPTTEVYSTTTSSNDFDTLGSTKDDNNTYNKLVRQPPRIK